MSRRISSAKFYIYTAIARAILVVAVISESTITAAAADVRRRGLQTPHAVDRASISRAATAVVVDKRQTVCPRIFKICGDGCIPADFVCCEDRDGGGSACEAGSRCIVDVQGTPGCCPDGLTCGIVAGPTPESTTIVQDVPPVSSETGTSPGGGMGGSAGGDSGGVSSISASLIFGPTPTTGTTTSSTVLTASPSSQDGSINSASSYGKRGPLCTVTLCTALLVAWELAGFV